MVALNHIQCNVQYLLITCTIEKFGVSTGLEPGTFSTNHLSLGMTMHCSTQSCLKGSSHNVNSTRMPNMITRSWTPGIITSNNTTVNIANRDKLLISDLTRRISHLHYRRVNIWKKWLNPQRFTTSHDILHNFFDWWKNLGADWTWTCNFGTNGLAWTWHDSVLFQCAISKRDGSLRNVNSTSTWHESIELQSQPDSHAIAINKM
jgi:hypothetical protein